MSFQPRAKTDRFFPSYKLWQAAAKTGADLLWRTRRNSILKPDRHLEDGFYLTRIYPSTSDRRRGSNAIVLRVIDYHLDKVPGAVPIYRLITSVLSHQQAPAKELAALYHQRWEIETALDELKTNLRGAQIVLRSKTPELVKQEFYGLLMAHFAARRLMHEVALQADEDPDRFGTSSPTPQGPLCRYSPLGRAIPFIRRCLEKSFRNGVCRAATGSTRAV